MTEGDFTLAVNVTPDGGILQSTRAMAAHLRNA
jgi:hypothetical protein